MPCKQGSQGRRRRHSICAPESSSLWAGPPAAAHCPQCRRRPVAPKEAPPGTRLARAHAAGHARRGDRPVSRSHAPDGAPSTAMARRRRARRRGVWRRRRRGGGPDRRPGAGPAGPPPAAASNPAHGGTAPHTRSPPSRRGRAAAG